MNRDYVLACFVTIFFAVGLVAMIYTVWRWPYAEIVERDGTKWRVYANRYGAIKFDPPLLINPENGRSVSIDGTFTTK